MNLGIDKLHHFVYGFSLGLSGGLAHPFLGTGLALSAGAGKEVWDDYGHGTPDPWDFVATLAGGLVGVAWAELGKSML